jgi:two-component system, response regulator YesN
MQSVIGLLIVDDEDVTRQGLATLVDWGALGVRLVGTATNGLEALRELELHHPAIVILDIRMPELDGMSLLSIIRARYPSTRAILVSGFEDFANAQKAVNLAAFAFLTKPIDTRLLLDKVRDAVEAVRSEQAEVRGSEELRREFGRFTPALRASLLCRLMTPAAFPEEEAVAQAGFLGVAAPAEFPRSLAASVAVLEPRRGEQVRDADPASDGFGRFALTQRAEATLGACGRSFAFPYGQSVCAVVFHGPEDRPAVRRCCQDLIAWAGSALGLTVSAGIGLPVARLTDLHASYDSALQALGYRFMLGRTEAIDFTEVREHVGAAVDEGPSLAELHACSTAIAHAVRLEDPARAGAELQRLAVELTRRLARPTGIAPGVAYLLSFVLMDVDISLGLPREGDVFAVLASCATPAEVVDRARGLLSDLVRRAADSGKKRDDALAARAVDYMRGHVLVDISLTAVAEALRIHPNYLSTIFHASTGKTFIEHEIDIKMETAKRLFADGDYRVYEVAGMLKYRDVNHFTRVFKTHVGVSPSEYRGTL